MVVISEISLEHQAYTLPLVGIGGGNKGNRRRGQGVNPLLQTQRGKLQQKRNALNEQINKELRLRVGAENLLRATSDKRLKEQISVELDFVNSNIQLLKDELSDLNTAVDVYQNERCIEQIPFITLGLKESKDIHFEDALKVFVSEHYYEDPEQLESAIQKFAAMRHAIITNPQRTEAGVQLMFEYYNHLYYVERRFFTPSRQMGIYFQWFDSFTGVPALQKSVAFEKGSILFNIAALYTQVGAKQDRNTSVGLESASEQLCCAAGVIHYLKDNFSHSPSVDMRSETLEALKCLTLTQAQECLYELQLQKLKSGSSFKEFFGLAKEAAHISQNYNFVYNKFTSPPVCEFLPETWSSMALIKRYYYKALAHYYTAIGVLLVKVSQVTVDCKNIFRDHFEQFDSSQTDGSGYTSNTNTLPGGNSKQVLNALPNVLRFNGAYPPETLADKKIMARVHLRESVSLIEDCIQIVHLSKSLSKSQVIRQVLRRTHDKAAKRLVELNSDDDVDLLDAPSIKASTILKTSVIPMDLKRFRVEDLFRSLGPLNAFNARQEFFAPRVICLQRSANARGFGFCIKGDAPVYISAVEPGSLAHKSGVLVGDIIIGIQKRNRDWLSLKWSKHDELVNCIRESGSTLLLNLVTPKEPVSTAHNISNSVSTVTTTSSYSSSSLSSYNGSTLLRSKSQAETSSGTMTFNSLKRMKSKKDRSKLSMSTWNIKKLFSKRKFRSEPELTNPEIYMR